jgi:hypothetical protein
MATKKIKYIIEIKDLQNILLILLILFSYLKHTEADTTKPAEDKNTKYTVQHRR